MNICKMLKIENNYSTGFHHQTMGQVGKSHSILNAYLRAYVNHDKEKDDWEERLKYFIFCYNNSYNSTNNFRYTPFELRKLHYQTH